MSIKNKLNIIGLLLVVAIGVLSTLELDDKDDSIYKVDRTPECLMVDGDIIATFGAVCPEVVK